MIPTVLVFVVLAISSAVLGMYAGAEDGADQGLDFIMYWFAIASLGTAAMLTVVYLARRFAGP
jgi:hypothetical protein